MIRFYIHTLINKLVLASSPKLLKYNKATLEISGTYHFDPTFTQLQTSAISGNYAYFGMIFKDKPVVVKFDLQKQQIVHTMTINTIRYFSASFANSKYLYMVANYEKIITIDIANFHLLDSSLTFNYVRLISYDAKYAFLGFTDTKSGIFKLDLNTRSMIFNNKTHIDVAISNENGDIYGVDTSLNLIKFDSSLNQLESVELGSNNFIGFMCGIINGNYLYLAGAYFGNIIQVNLIDYTIINSVVALYNNSNPLVAVESEGYGYFGSFSVPSVITKVDLQSLTIDQTMVLDPLETPTCAIAYGDYVYFATTYSYYDLNLRNSTIVEIDRSNLTISSRLTMPTYYFNIMTLVGDVAYLVYDASLIPLNLTTFQIEPSIQFNTTIQSYGSWVSAVAHNNFIYYGSSDGSLLKFDTTSGAVVAANKVYTASTNSIDSGVIYGNYGYFAGHRFHILKVDLDTLKVLDTLVGPSNAYNNFIAIVIENIAYFAHGTNPDQVSAINLDSFSIIDSVEFDSVLTSVMSYDNAPYYGGSLLHGVVYDRYGTHATTTGAATDKGDSGLGIGAIIGIIVAGAVLLLIIIVIIVLLIRRRK